MIKILRLKQVKERTGLSKSTIYEEMSLGRFPKSFKLSSRTVGWEEDKINKWIEEKAKKLDSNLGAEND